MYSMCNFGIKTSGSLLVSQSLCTVLRFSLHNTLKEAGTLMVISVYTESDLLQTEPSWSLSPFLVTFLSPKKLGQLSYEVLWGLFQTPQHYTPDGWWFVPFPQLALTLSGKSRLHQFWCLAIVAPCYLCTPIIFMARETTLLHVLRALSHANCCCAGVSPAFCLLHCEEWPLFSIFCLLICGWTLGEIICSCVPCN